MMLFVIIMLAAEPVHHSPSGFQAGEKVEESCRSQVPWAQPCDSPGSGDHAVHSR